MKFFIFRHAETYPSREFLPYDEGDKRQNFETDILYSGRESMRRIGEYLKDKELDFCVSSPYERCKESVEIVSGIIGKEFAFDERIGEFMADMEYSEFRKRIEEFLVEIETKGYKSAAICTHGAVISQLMHLLCDKEPEEDITIYESVYSGILLEVENKQFKEISFNE